MAKIKVINAGLDQNLNGVNFNDTPSNTIFSFGSFNVTSNFDGKTNVDYSNTLSSFVRPVTLETMGVSEIQSQIFNTFTTNAVLNLDNSDLNTFVRFGSAYELLRVSVQNIILAYPGSLIVNSQRIVGGNLTYTGLTYNSGDNTSTFYIPINALDNVFGLVYNANNVSIPNDNELKNLNISYGKYVVSTSIEPELSYSIIGFTGNTINDSNVLNSEFIRLHVIGNPFLLMGSGDTGVLSFHIKPNNVIFEEFRAQLNGYEKYIVSERDGVNGFKFTMKNPTLLDDGNIIYNNSILIWPTIDGYNVDINTPQYRQFLEILLTIGAKYDKIKTDLIARFLSPASLKTYDFTEEGKMTKLLRIYGREFDQIRQFIDSLVCINKVSYNKTNNIPDQIVMNMARTFGWDYFSLINENELIDSFLTINDDERNLNEDLLPSEIDVELWRRILNNTSYFWKSKGTRESIKSMFLLIGIPEPFINITEYVYTVDGKINPNTVAVKQQDFPTNSLPYDNNGYPVAPLETNSFYFQVSGDTDGGQRYLDVFRMAGFNLQQTIDNKKTWVQTGSTTRIHSTTPQYYQEDSRLVINTKEIDISLDTARGIEYDVYRYIKDVDFPANNSGYTLPYSYVNISLDYSGVNNVFQLPTKYDNTEGDLEIRYNGILLNAPKTGMTTDFTNADYSVSGTSFTLLNNNYAINSGNRRDVIQATFIYSGASQSITGISVQYIVTRIKANLAGTIIPLPSMPRGDVQVTINGIALTKGTSQFNADYIVDSASNQIIIQNQDVIAYLIKNQDVQVAYVEVDGSNDINARCEVMRVDSFNTNKIYFNSVANRYVFKLNYKVNDAADVKFLVDGIALEPNKDYVVNILNPFEIFIPTGIKYGTVISVYYLVGGNSVFTPVVSDDFGIGDISKLSFLEFLELVQRKMINARNRKTITDSKGGWYPTILQIYETYLKRSSLSNDDTLHSNGYTFENLYPFLSKYNAFFQRFVDQLLSATIIVKKGGLLIRNSVFTKQKFTYKRGVNLVNNNRLPLQYFGDDGSTFFVRQEDEPIQLLELYVDTVVGVAGIGSIVGAGGMNIIGFDKLTQYGIEYKLETSTTWEQNLINGSLVNNSFIFDLTGLLEGHVYQYRAIVISNDVSITGDILSLKTLATQLPLIPSGLTKQAISTTQTSIVGTGAYAIQRHEDIEWYGMQYELIGSALNFNVNPDTFNDISSSQSICNVTVVGDVTNTFTVSAVSGVTPITWLLPEAPKPPLPTGSVQTITITENSGIARTGCVVYTPTIGVPQVVVLNQQAKPIPPVINVSIDNIQEVDDGNDFSSVGMLTQPLIGESYYAQICWQIKRPTYTRGSNTVYVKCNGVQIPNWCCSVNTSGVNLGGSFGTKLINHDDCLTLHTNSHALVGIRTSALIIGDITNNVGNYSLGSPSMITSIASALTSCNDPII